MVSYEREREIKKKRERKRDKGKKERKRNEKRELSERWLGEYHIYSVGYQRLPTSC